MFYTQTLCAGSPARSTIKTMKLKLTLTTIVLGLFAQSYACKCGGPGTVKEAFKNHQLIVYGKVTSKDTVVLSETIKEDDARDVRKRLRDDKQTLRSFEMTYVLKIHLEIIQKYKGDSLRGSIVIYTPLLTASCGYTFEEGKEYIVYASSNNFLSFLFRKEGDNTRYEQDSSFWTNHCTRTTEYTQSESDQLRALTTKTN